MAERPSTRAPLLLHSLAEFRPLLLPLIDLVNPKRIVEIGAEEAAFTSDLLRWVTDHGADLETIEPYPTERLRELARTSDRLHLHAGLSLEVLPELDAAELYVIDGDHNYHTVRSELTLAQEAHGGTAGFVAFLHDVGWPCGRRDQYYDPSTIPPDSLHEHTFTAGIAPGETATVPSGFRGNGEFAAAVREGGPANGVLTAIEDFMAEFEGWELLIVPAVFGLGILHPREWHGAERLREIVAPFSDNPLLRTMEENRLDLFVRVIQLQDEVARVDRELSAIVDDLHLELRAAESEVHALRARHAELVGERDAATEKAARLEAARSRLAAALDEIVRSRAFPATEAISRVHAAVSGHSGVTRARLRALLNECQP